MSSKIRTSCLIFMLVHTIPPPFLTGHNALAYLFNPPSVDGKSIVFSIASSSPYSTAPLYFASITSLSDSCRILNNVTNASLVDPIGEISFLCTTFKRIFKKVKFTLLCFSTFTLELVRVLRLLTVVLELCEISHHVWCVTAHLEVELFSHLSPYSPYPNILVIFV